MEVAERIRVHSASLTAAERRVAEAILRSPQSVGFGTVADLADSAGVGAASVVRLASKLGFEGYSDLQASIQHDLMRQLRPAVERIDETIDAGPGSAHAAVELANVRATLDVAVRRDIAVLPDTATVIVIDLRRYERWVLDAHEALCDRGVWSAAFTDSILSPLAARADVMFVVSADSVGPFDSHVGTLALLNLVAAEAAGSLRNSARDRLAAVEAAWSRHRSLTDSN